MVDTDQNKGHTEEPENASRRDFLKKSGYAAGGVAGGLVLGGLFGQFDTAEEGANSDQVEQLQNARTFFKRREDFETLAYASERIYPEDENGPGAIKLGVPYFIDKQLAGYYGYNAKTYMKGPFQPQKSGEYGLQTKLNRGEVFLHGLRKMQEVSQKDFGSKFAELEGEQQDEILRKFEANEIKLKGVQSSIFFELLRQTTIEGVYSDPVYGGNKDMQGWKMIEYPGPRMGWANEIDAEEFLSKEPMSLKEYQGGNL